MDTTVITHHEETCEHIVREELTEAWTHFGGHDGQ